MPSSSRLIAWIFWADSEELHRLRRHATRASHRRLPPPFNRLPALAPRAAQVSRNPTNGGFINPYGEICCDPAIRPSSSKMANSSRTTTTDQQIFKALSRRAGAPPALSTVSLPNWPPQQPDNYSSYLCAKYVQINTSAPFGDSREQSRHASGTRILANRTECLARVGVDRRFVVPIAILKLPSQSRP
jgi:hypothetical protein